MKTKQTPREALNKAFLKIKPTRQAIELFKTNLKQLLATANADESEEFHKNLVSDFFKNTYYKDKHFINTKGRNDLVIHNLDKPTSTVGVIIEAKKPTNKAEMPTTQNLNSKALQELVLYYLRERITEKNLELKQLVITNTLEWFVFDAQLFEKHFAQNKALVRQFQDFEQGRSSGKTTDFFYKEIAAPCIDTIKAQLPFTYFDIAGYQKPLYNQNPKDDVKLITLYKVLSPEHLLKLPFANDSNSLDRNFYDELLHIIGLSETKEGGKKVIGRTTTTNRNNGALLENAVVQLDSLDKISRLAKPSEFGATYHERLFNVSLELTITWVNRILFLKLLEAQLITYHKGDASFAFLNAAKMGNYDALNKLFFQVLAKEVEERQEAVSNAFGKVPYLNSSLFEPTELEHNTLFISGLEDDYTLPVYTQTVLKDKKGKRLKGALNPLAYFFEFLDAYDFSGEGGENIQEENKTLINASVLGLIFEKINGYRDGSFFTPGFITMYMCRQTIRQAVLQKFNETKGWACANFDALYENIDNRQEANELINSLKICDPAVGSGHFLVSALNELIAVKHDLKILQDRSGKRLKEYVFEVVNDELIVTDDDGEFFEYHPDNVESQRVQETLFHEKQTLIENCLFGVDINPNSVKICRLRLWIELLKNAYYRTNNSNENRQLETLPNIDINIKCGNSLISRFALNADIKKALRKSKWGIQSYQMAVNTYRHAKNKAQKHSMEQLIADIKGDFRSEINSNDPKLKRLQKVEGEYTKMLTQQQMFELSKKEKTAFNKKVKNLYAETTKLRSQIEEIKSNRIYENAFEWRFEFPEVLNEQGAFEGFDVVIGNPPYIRHEALKEFKPYLAERYTETAAGTADLYVYFVELGLALTKPQAQFVYILPNKWMRAGYGANLRSYLQQQQIVNIVDFGDLPVFEEATTYPCILHLKKAEATTFFNTTAVNTLQFATGLANYIQQHTFEVDSTLLPNQGWTLTDAKTQRLLQKIKTAGVPLGEYVNGKIYYGIKTGLNEAFVIDHATKEQLIQADPAAAEIIKPFLAGRDIKRYKQPESDNYLILFPSGFTKTLVGKKLEEKAAFKHMKAAYPSIMQHLAAHEEKARKRYDQGQYWWELRACDYYEEFEKEKIVWPETSLDNQFCFVPENIHLNKTTFFIPLSDYYLLALLNSKLARFYFSSIVSKMRGGYFSMSKAYAETIGIADGLSLFERISSLAKLVIKMKAKEIESFEIESQIDNLVYSVYNLSEEEIGIIEHS